jgi:hypothetical protein
MSDLRRRLQFHSIKIRLVVDRLSIKFLTEADSKLDGILAITTENLQLSRDTLDEIRLLRYSLFGADPGRRPPVMQMLLQVPSAIAVRFERGLEVNAPSTYLSELPLAEAFDALYFHFADGVRGSSQSPEADLQLLKCCWLVEKVQRSSQYSEASPAFYYRRAVTQVDMALRTRIRRHGGLSHAETTILSLPQPLFEIWPPPAPPQPVATVPQQPNPISVQGMERRLAQIRLATDSQAGPDVVHVFQQSDQSLYRIALETSTSSGERYIREQPFFTGEHRLIPRYALPTMPDPIPEMAVFSHNQCHFYRFQNYDDLWAFQAAFTGYEVSHDQPAVWCQFGPNLGSFVCNGRVQLWQEPVEYRTQSATAGASPQHDKSAPGKAASSTQSRKASFAPSLAHTTNYTSTKDALVAENIKHAALIIYTQVAHAKHGDRFAIVSIELGENVDIDREACACKHGYDGCSKLVLASRNKTRLPMRTVYSSETSGLQDPNTFDVLPLRLPRRPDYHDIKIRDTEHVVLKFADLEAKTNFDRELQNRFVVRDAQRKHMADTEKRFLHMANHPQRQGQNTGPRDLRRQSTAASFVLSPSIVGPAPQLARPEMGAPLGVAIAHGTDPRPIRASNGHLQPSLSTSPLSNVSSLGASSSGNRTNSTVLTEPEAELEVANTSSSTMGQMSTLLSAYRLDDGPPSAAVTTRPRAAPLSTLTSSSLSQVTEQPSHPVRKHSPVPLSSSPRSPATGMSTTWRPSPTAIFPRSETGTTARSTSTSSSASTTQISGLQQPSKREKPRTNSTKGFKGFRQHVFGSL